MMKPRNLGALLALGALTALPACSMFGGGNEGASSGRQYSYNAPPAYPSSSATSAASGMSNAASANETMVPTTRSMVRKVQSALKQNNDYNGRVDGVWGPNTEHGVRQWQQSHNLTVNGKMDMATLQSMNISGDNQDNQATNGTYDNNQPNNGSQATNGTIPTSRNLSNDNGNMPAANQNAQDNGSQTYNTAGSHQTNGSYTSNNNGNPPANTPYPTNQGNMNNGNTSNGAPSH